jgi:hypothetical protein
MYRGPPPSQALARLRLFGRLLCFVTFVWVVVIVVIGSPSRAGTRLGRFRLIVRR